MTSAATPRRRAVLRAALAGSLAGALAACSGSEDAEPSGESAGDGAGTTEPEEGAGSAEQSSDPEATSAEAARPETIVATALVDQLQVFAEPEDMDAVGESREPEMVLDRTERTTGQLVLLALQTGDVWTQVQLPVRPNGSTGWVRSNQVSHSGHSFRIDVDLAGHEIVVTNAGTEVARTPVGVGRSDRPTPGGDYFVTELLQPPDPDGIYGPYAYGLSGYSDVVMDFRGGEGVIGIHGTNEPELIGTDVSSGCIRMDNAEIVRLVEQVGLPLGTPVTIRA
ncbi:ErfK/YbiS/YcfS/YnhG [Serinicoccus hydrothermalis]|uniref:ErfK/YbiS/YcfS/YnhG n=1 Tax=Serinicoccus hydrothermalis TaxID=1758689 RepID=A0A1B1NFL8_9MICO|nr:L,D-transpeptidase [Serinicoccus hydrothermalis]ANS80219.1 ErfK/YbiS/YcfS/YnhG [Serinicoccus hydrothermalis]